MTSIQRLSERTPTITGAEIAAELTPPPQFAHASFDSYRPNPNYPSQADAVTTLRAFAAGAAPVARNGFFGRRKKVQAETGPMKPGVYLDGGFGVGKTHLLAALWHVAGGRKYFGTFIEYTALVGALGYARTVEELRGASLLCIDEFELDDPGDTMLMTRLLSELVAGGTRVAATSNTPPNALGEGRFAAADFLREIQAMASHFQTLRIDGVDFRQRGIDGQAGCLTPEELARTVTEAQAAGRSVTLDEFDALMRHLATVHPSRYIKMLAGIDMIALEDVVQLTNQTDALRLVAFVDRVYDAQIPIVASGLRLDEVFGLEMLQGGYRKKYLRAISRLVALTNPES